MRRIFALILCLALALGAAAAVAEEKTYMGTLNVYRAFTLQCRLPEDYVMITGDGEEPFMAVISHKDEAEGKPYIVVSIAFDELLSGVERLNDLDDSALALIEGTFGEEDPVDISYMETAYGTKVMVVRDGSEHPAYVDFYTIYKGYEVEIVLVPGGDPAEHPVTEEQVQMVMSFISDMDFVPAD